MISLVEVTKDVAIERDRNAQKMLAQNSHHNKALSANFSWSK